MSVFAVRMLALSCLVAPLVACAPARSYAGAVATARAAGCWPGNALPPAPVTVTPGAWPATPLPTTTPYPRCTPEPGEAQRAWPTPLPPRAPFPTMRAFNQPGSAEMRTIMRLPDAILSVDIAANPLSGDPVLAAIAAPLTGGGRPHAFVSAYDGQAHSWGTAQSLDIGAAAIGAHRFRSVAVAVAGDGAITAVWGATSHPAYGLWASTSRDGGASWGAPQHLADNIFGVLDVAAALDGRLAVLALRREPVEPVLITRDAAGWGQPDPLPVASAWYGSSGSVQIVGEGAGARAIALTSGFGEPRGALFLATRPLAGGAWRVEPRRAPEAGGQGIVGNVRGLAAGGAAPIVAFSFSVLGAPGVYAVVSRDGGASWDAVAPIAPASARSGDATPFSALAYDPAAGALAAFWTCCADARWDSAASTHYAAWAAPGAAEWRPRMPAPLLSGAAAAGDTAIAQAPNSRAAWLAWVEHANTVAVRAIDLDRVIDTGAYPTPTAPAGAQP